MDRLTILGKYLEQSANQGFVAQNVPKILENLERAEKDGALKKIYT